MNSSWNERVGIQTQVLAMNRNSPTDRKWIIDEKKWNFDFLAWINVCNHKGTHCRFHWSKWWTAVANFHKINHQMQLQVTSSAAAFLIEKKDSRRLAISSPMYETSSNSFGSPVDFQVSCITGAFAFIYGRGVSNVRGRPAALGALSNPQFSKRLAIKSQPIYLSLYIYICVYLFISRLVVIVAMLYVTNRISWDLSELSDVLNVITRRSDSIYIWLHFMNLVAFVATLRQLSCRDCIEIW